MIALSTIQTGDAGELAFMLEATLRNLKVSKPIGSFEGYDVVVDNGCKLIKVQVKASRWQDDREHKRLQFTIARSLKDINVVAAKFDVLVCYDLDNKDFYILNSSEIKVNKISFASKTATYPSKNNWNVLLEPNALKKTPVKK